LEKLAAENPSVTLFQSELGLSHNNIGASLSEIGKPAEALKEYESTRAIWERLARQHPEFPHYANDMGGLLNNIATIDINSGRFDVARDRLRQAIAWQKQALAVNPKNPQFRQFLANDWTSFIKAARGLNDPEGVAEAERELAKLRDSDPAMAALDSRLSAIIKGVQQPKDNAERLQLAPRACDKALYITAAQLWGDAMATDPKLGDDRNNQIRYNAACAASLAAAGRSKDKPELDEAGRTKLREQALGWLRADLSAWKQTLMVTDPAKKALVTQVLTYWKGDGDLAVIRDAMELAKLPEEERRECEKLWADVDVVLKSVASPMS
jgi:tetratricopeptide (TPR) repeat protein